MTAIGVCPAVIDLLNWHRVEVQFPRPPVFFTNDQISIFEHSKVSHDRDPAHIKLASEHANRLPGIRP